MATFNSTSPGPRRSSRIQPQVGSSQPVRRAAQRLVPSSSRNAPLRRQASLVQSDPSTSMDVDEDVNIIGPSETTYAKNDELEVSFYANLPIEVKRELRNADFYKTAYMGGIDTTTGFAVVASSETCFVWQHAQAIKGTPTCYIFQCPHELNALHPPFHALIPQGPTQEPGLILLSHSGQIRFWESIGIGLAGGDNYAEFNLGLLADEHVTNLIRVDSQLFVASTSQGGLFRLVLTSTGGQYHLTSRNFSRPPTTRSLASLFPWSSSNVTDPANSFGYIRSIAVTPPTEIGERAVWVLGEEKVQIWIMKPEGWEEKVLEQDAAEIVFNSLEGRARAGQNMDLELLDLALDENEKFVLLVSYSGVEETGGVKRLYALAQMERFDNFFGCHTTKVIPYQNTSAPSAPVAPRIQLLFKGSIVSIEFGDTVAFCSQNSDYVDRIQLKSSADRTLGVGVNQATNTLLVLTATTMMQVQLAFDNIRQFDSETGQTKLIGSILMQAILYGASSENPLHFSFPPEVNGANLMDAAKNLSRQVLESHSSIIRRNHDLTAHFNSRRDRLVWLIGFINENLALAKMSQECRQRLAVDAEKLFACNQLWVDYNELLEATAPKATVLNDCVHQFMKPAPNDDDDILRKFFRTEVQSVGDVVRRVYTVVNMMAKTTGRSASQLLPEGNQIVITALRSAFAFREHHAQVYGIEPPMIKPWTSKAQISGVVHDLFNATLAALERALVEEPHSEPRERAPGIQLPQLCQLYFQCVYERLEYLESPVAGPEAAVERKKLEHEFGSDRPGMLESLRSVGFVEEAFTLAEEYHDFASLVALCHRQTVYPPEENPEYARIQHYVQRYKEEFTEELYQWYIRHGELRTMLAQESEQSAFIDKFFTRMPNPNISWLHDLAEGRYHAAEKALYEVAGNAKSLEVKHLMLSLGKLSTLTQLHETGEEVDQEVLDAFHDQLDFISVHDGLLTDFKSALPGVRGKQSLDSQVDAIIAVKAPAVKETKSLAKCFKDLLKQLLQGKALTVEDAVDLLTLKDNSDNLADYATALHLLASANIPAGRRLSAFRAAWRKVYLHDDWTAIGKTANIGDAEITTRLKGTALFATLCAILDRTRRERMPTGYETNPDSAVIPPTSGEVSSRWTGLSQEQVDGIVKDYKAECEKLRLLDLEDIYHRVRELAVDELRQWTS